MKKQKEIIVLNVNEWFWKLILKNTKAQTEIRDIEKRANDLRFKIGSRVIDIFFKGGNLFAHENNNEYFELSEKETSIIKKGLLDLVKDTLNRKEEFALKEVNRLLSKLGSELKNIDKKINTRRRHKAKLQMRNRALSKFEYESRKRKFNIEDKKEKRLNERMQRCFEKFSKLSNFRDKLKKDELTLEEIFARLGGVNFSEDY